ncbi:DsbA family protein [Chitinophaga sp. GCM10012297]|uniref:DsbA family protein n=1 Tax=Chitinophaga chungangae TaxID=2821488 RepID=A0ABS3YBH8_9BACT|nr:DsbA family protein [Chitinophaga chungangae]MBO9152028.1 DsbA family protein [Chitinophaga chungangae]
MEQTQLHITYYTDPLCCWSWAMEPAWRQLLASHEGRVSRRYCMGGLLQDWQHYHDPEQHVSRPIQMGPVWLDAKYASGQPINERIWIADPPASSYPACLAVKCAALQSPDAEEVYLYALRKAVMADCRNIAKKEILLAVAGEVAAEGLLDAGVFIKDLEAGNGLESFRADLQETAYRGIHRFPSMVLQSANGEGLVIKGYRPLPSLLEAAEKVLSAQTRGHRA